MSLAATGNVEAYAFHQNTLELLRASKRRDGRQLNDIRSLTAQRDVADRCLASAMVSLGGSVAQCAVRGCFGPPTPSAPDEGRLEVLVEAPFASPHLDTTQDARRAVAVFVRDVLRSTLCTKMLAVVPGEACWVLNVDITILGADGSLRPLCLHAVVAALQRVVIPRARLPNGDYSTEFVWGYNAESVLPVAVTCALAQSSMLLDTTAAEESIADALLTVVLDERTLATSAPAVLYVSHHGGHPTGGAKALESICAALFQNKDALRAVRK